MQGYPDGLVLEDKSCPNGCARNDSFVLEGQDRLHGIPGRFKIVACKHCGLLRTNPRPTPETIGIYYPSDYGPYQDIIQPITQAKSKSKFKLFVVKLLNMDSRVLPPVAPGNLLEIGCSSGAYLLETQKKGWAVEGIEYSAIAAKKAVQAGLKVQISSLEDAQAPTQAVDIIAAWMVLEHLHQPVAALAKIRGWIKPNGFLVASFPDSSSLMQKVFGEYCYDLHLPNHLYHYAPKTIERVLNSAGWQLIRVSWQKNANTLLNSLEYVATQKQFKWLIKTTGWIKLSNQARYIRLILNWLAGVTKQSGRIEIWAQPKVDKV